MGHFTPLQKELEKYIDAEHIGQIYKAYSVAFEAHRGQKRSSGEPYIVHPVAAAMILANMRMDYQSIMATLLHDILEDTTISKAKLFDTFGEEVTELVDGVSKLKQIQFSSQAEAQAENFRKMILAMVKDIRVIMVKLADRLHNMQTIHNLPFEKRKRISLETLEIYAPIANRLGMHYFYVQLEDLCLKALRPMRYRIIFEARRRVYGDQKEIMKEIHQRLESAIAESGISKFFVYSREKHVYSIYRKMLHKKTPFSEIMDMYGFRIIVDDVDSCYKSLGVVHRLYKPVMERFKDYIAIPKINNYQSLHTTLLGPYGIPIEVQIRTERMNRVARNGIASHWLYKYTGLNPKEAQTQVNKWLHSLVEMQHKSGSWSEFIESVKIDLSPDKVYVFTPEGDIIVLPKGATPIDFAYIIHSDIGNTCVATRVNRQYAPLSVALSNGQTVEVITSKNSRPNINWLNFVVTGKAKSNIRDYLKHQQHSESVRLGKKLLELALNNCSATIAKLKKSSFDRVDGDLGYESKNELFKAIGLGNQVSLVIAKKLLLNENKVCKNRGDQYVQSLPLLIKGTEGMVVHFAECCRPIPGDQVVGHIRTGHGIVVHVARCKYVANYSNNPEKYVSMNWAEEVVGNFKVDLVAKLMNKRGVLALIVGVITDLGADIENVNIDQGDGEYYHLGLTITVKDKSHLAKIIKRIKATKFVLSITRDEKNLRSYD